MCKQGHWRGIDSYSKDRDQPVQRDGRVVLEQCTECYEYREIDVEVVLERDNE